ncbi:unnamed protein product [Arctogadus glacialis]
MVGVDGTLCCTIPEEMKVEEEVQEAKVEVRELEEDKEEEEDKEVEKVEMEVREVEEEEKIEQEEKEPTAAENCFSGLEGTGGLGIKRNSGTGPRVRLHSYLSGGLAGHGSGGGMEAGWQRGTIFQ